VPGSAHSPLPTVTSRSSNAVRSTYGGSVYGAAAGLRNRPATFPVPSYATLTSMRARANLQVSTTITCEPVRVTLPCSTCSSSPACATSVVHVDASAASGSALAIAASNVASTSANLPAASSATSPRAFAIAGSSVAATPGAGAGAGAGAAGAGGAGVGGGLRTDAE